MAQDSAALLADARKAYDSDDVGGAEALYRRVLEVDKKNAEAMRMMGLIAAYYGRLDEGLTYMDQAIAAKPEIGRLYYFRGTILEHMRRFKEALDAYKNALAREPEFIPAYISQGIAFAALGYFEKALESYGKAIAINPSQAEAYFNRGNALNHLARYEEAVHDFTQATRLAPHFAPAFNNLGVALKNLGRFDEALAHYTRALQIDSSYYHAHNNIGVVQNARGHKAEALASYDAALTFNPEYAEACTNRGYTLQEMRQYAEALLWYDKAIAISPDDVDAHWNKCLLMLLLGDYENGLPLLEWRWKKSDMREGRSYDTPLWLGKESLRGKTILLHAEQGLGDTLQFCRYTSLIKALGVKIILEVQKPLVTLLGSLKSKPQIIAAGDVLPEHDYHCPLMSLPLACGTRVETIPADAPYLFTDITKRTMWCNQLQSTQKLRVGIVWSANANHKNIHARSIDLSQFSTLFTLKNRIEFHALQIDISTHEFTLLREHNVATYVTDIHDFSDTAALIAQMDLVISVDTATAHLAGALGKPVWILIPFAPDFRWLTERNDSPWYPTARLFRQTEDNNWPSVLAEVSTALTNYHTPSLDG